MITSLQQFNIHLIKEAAKSLTDINNLIIVSRQTTKEIKIVLFDHITQDIVSYIHATKVGHDQNFWEVERISAEQGYGPLMYDILLMTVYPIAVKPSSLIKRKALQVWQYYINNRPDVETEQIDPQSRYYVDKYKEDADGSFKTDLESLKIINTMFYKQPNQSYYDVLIKSKNVIESQKLDKVRILKNALDHFWQKYEV